LNALIKRVRAIRAHLSDFSFSGLSLLLANLTMDHLVFEQDGSQIVRDRHSRYNVLPSMLRLRPHLGMNAWAESGGMPGQLSR